MLNAVFSHVGVVADDPIALEKFYTKHFGFRRARVYAPGPEQVVMLKSGSFYLEIFKSEEKRPDTPSEAGPKYSCWRHLCFIVDDVEAKLAELGSEVSVTMGPVDMSAFIQGMKVAWCADPAGNIIELNQGYVDEDPLPPALD
jgi:glyoxylase I family protein